MASSRRTLLQRVMEIKKQKGWTHVQVMERIGISPSTYAKFRGNPRCSRRRTLEKIRTFVENPDRPTGARRGNGRRRKCKSGQAVITTELLEFIAEIDGDDCIQVVEIMQTLKTPSIGLDQLKRLLKTE